LRALLSAHAQIRLVGDLTAARYPILSPGKCKRMGAEFRRL
jgi:hypothetical protein